MGSISEFWIVCWVLLALCFTHTKSHMTYIFICSRLSASIYRLRLWMFLFLWKGQTCTCTIIAKTCLLKSRRAEFVKVIEIILMWESLAACWKRNSLQTFSKGRWGKPLARDYRSKPPLATAPCGCQWRPFTEAGWDTPPPAFSLCMRVHRPHLNKWDTKLR